MSYSMLEELHSVDELTNLSVAFSLGLGVSYNLPSKMTAFPMDSEVDLRLSLEDS